MVTLTWIAFLPLWTTLLVQVPARLAPALAAAAATIPAGVPGAAWLTLLVLPLMGVALLGEEAWLPWRRDEAAWLPTPTPVPVACDGGAVSVVEIEGIAVGAVFEVGLPCERCPVGPIALNEAFVAAPTRVRLDLAARARGARRVRRASVTRRAACVCDQPHAPRRVRAHAKRNGSRSRRGAPMSTMRTAPV